MAYKNTLQYYKELIDSGFTEQQASVQALQLEDAMNHLGDRLSTSINEFKTSMNEFKTSLNESLASFGKRIEILDSHIDRIDTKISGIDNSLLSINKDIFWMRVMGAAIFIAIGVPIIQKLAGH